MFQEAPTRKTKHPAAAFIAFVKEPGSIGAYIINPSLLSDQAVQALGVITTIRGTDPDQRSNEDAYALEEALTIFQEQTGHTFEQIDSIRQERQAFLGDF